MSCASGKPDPCGCCDVGPLPGRGGNPPGREALHYRTGVHADFVRRMRSRIHRATLPDGEFVGQRPLARLTTRAPDDPAIALIDAGAVLLDILTFYQERIANEGFLRTATERRSVLELARAIGYELRPGVAAEAFLAFTVDDADGAPPRAEVMAGTQVMSIPAEQGELPQTFETAEALEARVEWNALRPRMARPQPIEDGSTHVYIRELASGLMPGSLVLLILGGDPCPRQVRRVVPDGEAGHTRIEFKETLDEETPPDVDLQPGVLDPALERLELTQENVAEHIVGRRWRDADLHAFLERHEWSVDDVLVHVERLREDAFHLSDSEIHGLRDQLGFFGHNAPRQELLPGADSVRGTAYQNPWDGEQARSIWVDSQGEDHTGADVYLDRPVPGLLAGSRVVFSVGPASSDSPPPPGPTQEVYDVVEAFESSVSDYGISQKVTALRLHDPAKREAFLTRTTTAWVRSEALTPAKLPIRDDLAPGDTELWLDAMFPGLHPGRLLSISGEEADTEAFPRTEILKLSEVVHQGGYTRLTFEEGLGYGYRRESVRLNANVARASHGETVANEVLGSGDGRVPNQQFTLRKPPLTYVSARTPSGVESSLTVRVDGVTWEQRPSLYRRDPGEKVYSVRHDDDANATVTFGDGSSGARLPSGSGNVVVEYRTGIGRGGEVGAESLALLKTRPFGIREVVNPLPAAGAEDPEMLADARVNAPLTVLTLDRIVSLRDYEDFVRGFAGVGKAKATAVWNGEAEVVHITATSASGGPLVEPLLGNLLAAIERARDPLRAVEVASFQPLLFFVEAAVKIDDAHDRARVEKRIESALAEAFGFARRTFAEPVSASDVVQVIHGIEGLVAVDLDALYRTTPGAEPPAASLLNAVLPARPARYDQAEDRILPAELLLIHEFGITLTGMTT